MTSFSDSELAEDVGQCLIAGFDDTSLPDAVERALNDRLLGGVILFGRNVDDVDQLVALNEAIHRAGSDAQVPPFVAVDQEGGRVVRIGAPLTPLPAMRELAKAADQRDIVRVAEVQASELCALGINLNFAPVLDVDTNPDNPVIGDRAFSDQPEKVARCGAAVLLGHHTAGVIPCGKHFPGHGDTDIDSHLDLPRLAHDRDRLEEIELYPFQRAVAADIPMIMTAHIEVSAYDEEHPATFSPAIIDGILRERFEFDGVVVTDCLEMKAVADRYDIEEMVELGIEAGVDVFLICHTEDKWRRAAEHLVHCAEDDPDFRARIEESAERVRKLKRDLLGHWPRPWSPRDDFRDRIGKSEHRALVEPYLNEDGANDDPTRPE